MSVSTTAAGARYFLDNYPARVGPHACICGAWDLSDEKEPGSRFNLLIQLIESQKDSIDSIYYEVAPGLRGFASIWHLGYKATVEMVADRLEVPMLFVNASTWKKSVFDNSRASKEQIRAYAARYLEVDYSAPQDALDALCILKYALESG